MNRDPITVYIVDDSPVARELLGHIVQSDPAFKVIGYAANGEQALSWLKGHTPDVITMDIFMPGMNGLEVTRRIMATKPVPIVIISAAYDCKDPEQGFQALESGALAILETPAGFTDVVFEAKANEILKTIKTVAGVKLIRRRLSREPAAKGHTEVLKSDEIHQEPIEAVAIGSSLGGPLALAVILAGLPASFPVPIFIVQHIAAGFTQGLAKWLQGFSKLPIQLAEDNEIARPGHCYIAPARCHMEIEAGSLVCLDYVSKDTLKPSVGRLFASVAETYGKHAVGIILTGMGNDGAEGLLVMRHQGAYTIAQDEESCVMFGMPKEAIALGAVKKVLPLNEIPKALTALVSQVPFETRIGDNYG